MWKNIFGHPNNLAIHSRFHKGNLKCPFCNKVFLRNDRLQLHKRKCEASVKDTLENFENKSLIEIKISNNNEENFMNENVVENVVQSENLVKTEINFMDENLVENFVQSENFVKTETNFMDENVVDNVVKSNNNEEILYNENLVKILV